MKFNVKPGDRAIIIRHVCQENIGKLVHVVRAYDNDEILPGTQLPFTDLFLLGHRWVIEPLSGKLCALQGRGPDLPPVKLALPAMAMYDRWLRRLPNPDELFDRLLRPDDLDDSTSEGREHSLTKELATSD